MTRIKAPSHSDMVELVHTISQRIARYLEKAGLVVRDMENSYLDLLIDDEDSVLLLQRADNKATLVRKLSGYSQNHPLLKVLTEYNRVVLYLDNVVKKTHKGN